ncbi:hypothetical protein MKW94_030512, partial [Papaver nudicaule]|nr:hypothetical protein [Papaver nudicaule]
SLKLTDDLSTSFPTFSNLITLEVSIIKAQEVRTLFSFLRFSPNLESLVFGRVIFPDEVNEDALTLDVVPHCLLMHLKSIEFRDFEGQLSELELVLLFLQNAAVLQTVILGIPSYTSEDVKDFSNKIMEQLLKYKWASTDCLIKFTSSPYVSPKPKGSFQYVLVSG